MTKYKVHRLVLVNLAMMLLVSWFLFYLNSRRCFGIILSYRSTVFTFMFLQCQTAAANCPKPRAAIHIERLCVWAGMRCVGQAARTLMTWYKERLVKQYEKEWGRLQLGYQHIINPLNPELNPICYLLALLGAHHFLHVSRIRVKLLTFRRLMSYIYGAPILEVSRSHTTTQHSR